MAKIKAEAAPETIAAPMKESRQVRRAREREEAKGRQVIRHGTARSRGGTRSYE